MLNMLIQAVKIEVGAINTHSLAKVEMIEGGTLGVGGRGRGVGIRRVGLTKGDLDPEATGGKGIDRTADLTVEEAIVTTKELEGVCQEDVATLEALDAVEQLFTISTREITPRYTSAGLRIVLMRKNF
jgi:hypothetical protein